MLTMQLPDRTCDRMLKRVAIHNLDERDLRHHARRLQVVADAARVLKPGACLVSTDLLCTRRYAQHLRDTDMQGIQCRSAGATGTSRTWERSWWSPESRKLAPTAS